MTRRRGARETGAPMLAAALLTAACLALAAPAGAQFAAANNMNPMDHGPFVSSTITLDPWSVRGIIVHKGIAVRVGPDATMVFDTDLLRVVGAWTGGVLHWLPSRDGLQEWPTPDGHLHFLNAEKAGWSTSTNLNDPRGGAPTLNNARRYGPLGGDRRYEGLRVHGDTVVFSLRVADAAILERFGFARVQGAPIFTRTINVKPTAATLSLLVAPAPFGQASTMRQTMVTSTAGYVAVHSGGEARLVGFRDLPAGAEWTLENGHLALSLPALSADLRFQLSIGPLRATSDEGYMRAHLLAEPGSLDLTPLLDPGPARYHPLETEARAGVSVHGPFAVDELVLPRDNPWRSHLRLSAVDFLSDGRAVIASMSGDIWLVEGVQENLSTLRWRRFATGLNQPLGLVVVNDVIYVNGRDQITRLHDLNGDGHADYYENFNNSVMAATNYHAFNLNLEVDSRGRFLWAKSTPWPAGDPANLSDAHEITPHHGVLFRLSPDGRDLEIIATGLRNPNGLSIGSNDEIYYSDNEGNWVPTSKVTRIVEGAFHGFVPSAHRASLVTGWAPTDAQWVKPIIWTPHAGPGSDNSPSQPRPIASKAWPGALQGQLLLTSYGRGTLSLILMEEVDGQAQGAHMILPLEFQSGLQHMRFHRDGHLYLVGMTNWSSTAHGGQRGSFHRVRYTGGPLHLPVALHTRAGGLELQFAEPLDRASATNTANYRLSKWTYPWNATYGSRHFYSVDHPGRTGADPVPVESARLSDDGRTVFLEIPGLRPGAVPRVPITGDLPNQIEASIGMVMQIDYDLRAADGTAMKQLLHKTIHRVPGGPAEALTHAAPASPAPGGTGATGATGGTGAPGATGATDRTRPARQAARQPAGRVVVVKSMGTELTFQPGVISARAGETLTIRYENAGDMTHNIVVVKSVADIPVVGEAAFQAAFTNNWIPTAERHAQRIIAYTTLAGPRETVDVTFTVPGPGEYPFICTYASHWTVMQGRLVVTE